MKKTVSEQCHQLLLKSTHILLLLPHNPQCDFYCSALAFAYYCDTKKIKTTIGFCDPYEKMSALKFLQYPDTTQFTKSISGTRDLILSFNTKYNDIIDIKTERYDDSLQIFITPEKGMIDSRDFSFQPGSFPYNAIITFGAQDKESMGPLYDEIPDIYYELPIVNIDNTNANEQFGHINIVNTVASSVSEITFDLLDEWSENAINEPIAHTLLTGIISATNSFQNHRTTPHVLTCASKLLDYGANQQLIIKNLYRNQTFSLLQLWGAAMKKITTSKLHESIVLTALTQKDFIRTKAEHHHIYTIIDKMKQNYQKGHIFILLYEEKNGHFSALIDFEKSNIPIHQSQNKNFNLISEQLYTYQTSSKKQKNILHKIEEFLSPYIQYL